MVASSLGVMWVWRMQVASLATVKTIQVRNVPDATHAELRVRAAAAGMSLSDFILAELDRVCSKATDRRGDRESPGSVRRGEP